MLRFDGTRDDGVPAIKNQVANNVHLSVAPMRRMCYIDRVIPRLCCISIELL